jgi:hypothetical protein
MTAMSTGTGTATGHNNDRELLEEIRDNTRTMSLKLFGTSDAENETDKGRLPTLERSAKAAHAKIETFESKLIWASGFAAGVGSIIGGVIEFVVMKGVHKP